MATNSKSWGILGNPSNAQIEQYKSMKPGAFHDMVMKLSKGNKNKTLSEHTVYVSKRVMDVTVGTVVVEAFSRDAAMTAVTNAVRSGTAEINWDAAPCQIDQVEMIYQSYDPRPKPKTDDTVTHPDA